MSLGVEEASEGPDIPLGGRGVSEPLSHLNEGILLVDGQRSVGAWRHVKNSLPILAQGGPQLFGDRDPLLVVDRPGEGAGKGHRDQSRVGHP